MFCPSVDCLSVQAGRWGQDPPTSDFLAKGIVQECCLVIVHFQLYQNAKGLACYTRMFRSIFVPKFKKLWPMLRKHCDQCLHYVMKKSKHMDL